jgi:hypothetical protein
MQYALPAWPTTQLPALEHVAATSQPRMPQTMTFVWVSSHLFLPNWQPIAVGEVRWINAVASESRPNARAVVKAATQGAPFVNRIL